MGKPIVKVSTGAGKLPKKVEYHEGDTVESILARAGIKIKEGQHPTLGKRAVKDPKTTKVQAGDVIVIAGKPANG